MKQLAAVRAAVKAYGDRLGPEAKAVIVAAEGVAGTIDTEGGDPNLWREYRQLLKQLHEMAAPAVADDGEGTVLELVRAALGDDAQPEASKSGKADRRVRGGAGEAVDAVAATRGGRRRRTGH